MALSPVNQIKLVVSGPLADPLASRATVAALDSLTTAVGLKAAKTTTVTGGGLASGGGDLSANRTITVPAASQAEAEAGAAADRAMTPLGTKQQIDARRGAVNGIAALDGASKVPVAQIPSAAALGVATVAALDDTNDALQDEASTRENANPQIADADYALAFPDENGNALGGFDYAGRLAVELRDSPTPTIADSRYAVPTIDPDGNIIAGYDHAGRLDAEMAVEPVEQLADARYSHVQRDPAGNVLDAWDHQQRRVGSAAPPSFFARIDGGRVKLRSAAGEIDISTGELTALSVQMGGDYAYYDGLDGGSAWGAREAFLRPSTMLDDTVTTLVGMIWHGQSLSVGASSNGVINDIPLDPGRAQMFQAGVRAHGREHDDPAQAVDIRNLDNLVDLHESASAFWGETSATQAASAFLAEAPSTTGVIAAAVGVGGQQYTSLKKGTAPFSNLVAVAVRMVQVARLTGRTMSHIVVFWRQGESDMGDSKAAYTAKLVELQNDIDAAVKAVTGQATEVALIVDQVSAFEDLAAVGPPQAQLQVAIDNPTQFASAGPKYMLTYTDGLHADAVGQAWMGAYDGRVAASIVLDSVVPPPFRFASAVRSGTDVSLAPAGNVGAIAIDTSIVDDPGGANPMGVSWRDNGDGNAVTVTGVGISSGNLVAILSGIPTGTGGRILIAGESASGDGGPLTGPRACIRDSAGGSVAIDGDSYPLHNYAHHQIIPVT